MAHEIDESRGFAAAAFARTPAWHKLGKVLDSTFTAEEAIVAAGLDWTVEKRQLWRGNSSGQMVEESDTYAVVRQDTDRTLGIVHQMFQAYQNTQLADFLNAVIGLGAKLESAGSLHNGQKVWFLASLAESYDVIPGDQVNSYALFLNGHDGRTKFRVIPTKVRVVCQNTLSLATKNETVGMTIRHDGKLMENVEQAKVALGLVHTISQRLEIQSKALAATQMRQADLAAYFVRQVDALQFSEDRKREVMQELAVLEAAETNNLPGMRGTAWAAYNIFSEWVDHAPRRTGPDARLESIWMGAGNRQKNAAWTSALALAK